MKIFNATQVRACDNFTIMQEGISSHRLMEHAAEACLQWIREHFSLPRTFLVICGMGNNGGDGLALTRLLIREGYSAKAIVLKHREQFSEDASVNFKLLHQLAPEHIEVLEPGSFITEAPEEIILIDALFGNGISRALSGWVAEFVNEINFLHNTKIAIDLPSGLPSDTLPEPNASVIGAHYTLSFQFYKRSFLHAESEKYTGKIAILDIGLSTRFIENNHSRCRLTELEDIKSIYKTRNAFGHKGTYGTAILNGGSYGKMGAIALSTKAALRSGAGKVFVQAPDCGYEIVQILAPEAMFITAGERSVTQFIFPEHATALGIGPGLGLETATKTAFSRFLETCSRPVVLDADALNIIAENKTLLHEIPPQSILSPHPGEFERLFGISANSMAQAELARNQAMKYNICIILKGHYSMIFLPDGECWYNPTGNPGMATGGSGDVLTGILTGLLAQGYRAQEAAISGVYLHGLAGDLAAKDISEEALVAGDIVDYLGKAFLWIQ